MNRLTVIIPSRNLQNLAPCVRAVRQHETKLRILWIDDTYDTWPGSAELSEVLDASPGAIPVIPFPGVRPFVFARNINLGIREAGNDDVIVLGDDALLQTPGGFSALQTLANEHPEYGVIASSCNNVGNPNQRPQGTGGLREDPRMVCFVAVLIPRRTIDQVGLLDERYVGYGCDDDDYCVSVRKAALKIGIDDRCYVDHGSLTSSFRGPAGAGGNFLPNLKLFIEKWGVDNWGNPKARSPFAHLFPA